MFLGYDLPDLIITDVFNCDDFTYILNRKRRDGSNMVKLVSFDNTNMVYDLFDKYDLSDISEESYKKDLRASKLERIYQ